MWYDDSVVYQIYPLGAAGAPFENDHNLQNRISRFENWIKPVQKLGANVILFNPLFQSITHGYDTTDYRMLDERLGTNEDLKRLTNKIHQADMKVMFDAVFNHVGREFEPFQDVLKNRENSRYKDWFHIDFNGNSSYNDGLWYQNWEGYDALVKLNLQNPEVRQYLFDTVDFWMDEFGVDGLRMDVAYCMDKDFLQALREHVLVKNPDFFLFGEMIGGDYNTICNDQMLHSATNYECQKGIYSSFNSTNFYEILYSFNRQFGKDPWCLYTGKHLMSFLDNHDTIRIASNLSDKRNLPLAYAMLFTMPGIPIVYYGSEWGIKGKKNANDTEIRPEVEVPQSNELTETVSKLARIHRALPALINGDYTQQAINNGWCVYSRSDGNETVYTAINMLEEPVDIPVNIHQSLYELMNNVPYDVNGSIHIEPKSFLILSTSRPENLFEKEDEALETEEISAESQTETKETTASESALNFKPERIRKGKSCILRFSK